MGAEPLMGLNRSRLDCFLSQAILRHLMCLLITVGLHIVVALSLLSLCSLTSQNFNRDPFQPPLRTYPSLAVPAMKPTLLACGVQASIH